MKKRALIKSLKLIDESPNLTTADIPLDLLLEWTAVDKVGAESLPRLVFFYALGLFKYRAKLAPGVSLADRVKAIESDMVKIRYKDEVNYKHFQSFVRVAFLARTTGCPMDPIPIFDFDNYSEIWRRYVEFQHKYNKLYNILLFS